jgi:phage FluMu gp28-like protein
MIAIGTPKGRNWFHRWFKRGQSTDYPEVASFQAPTYQNPHIADSEIDSARDDMPDRVFEQEYLAKFVDDASGVFRNIREQNVETYTLPVSAAESTGPYSIGVDFARVEDWTVTIVLDDAGQIVGFDRLQDTTWTRIQQTVERFADTYTPNAIALDATRDNKIVQDLEDEGYFVDPVRFSPGTKRTVIENLITELEAGRIIIPESATELLNELDVYESRTSDRGQVRYTAPSGFHDDCVDALALAVSAEDPTPTTIPSTF